jgi:hypothetical protein
MEEKGDKKKNKEKSDKMIHQTEEDKQGEVNPNEYYTSRCAAIQNLIKTDGLQAYPHKFNVSHTIAKFHERFGSLCAKNGEFLNYTVSVAGSH